MRQNTIILSVFFFFSLYVLSAQTSPETDSIIETEIKSFTLNHRNLTSENSSQLIEIPIYSCSEENVNFIYSPLFKDPGIYIHMYFKKSGQERYLDSIFFITHSHFLVDIPKSEFENLRQENSCNFVKASKKETYTSEFYKAFLSEDHSRIYVYMLGGTGTEKYEVIWIVVNSQFHSRKLIPIVE
jgi:hypothetical protein